MKIHVLSDLHLEFSDFHPCVVEADVVVLAGDIHKGARGIAWARATFPEQEIVYVAGNHELYGTNRLDTMAKLRVSSEECDVHFLDDEEIVIRGVRFLGATLWTDFELFGVEKRLDCVHKAVRCMNDFRFIREGGRVFSPADSVRLHQKSVSWLQGALNRPFHGNTVVVTHHLPSSGSVADRFQSDLLSAAFASNLDHLMGKAVCWVHGHTHDSMDHEVYGTRIICNPRGYAHYEDNPENLDFDAGLVVEI